MSARTVAAAVITAFLAAIAPVPVVGNYPTFEGAAEFRDMMVPAGAPVGSLMYRLRASDHDKDYPLYFQATDFGSYVIRIENLPCPPNTTAGCQADVYLDRVLIPGQTFQFRITVRDTRGDTTTVPVRLVATEARSDVETIFPHIPAIIIVPEDVKVNSELEYVIVKKNSESRKSASIELRGSSELTIGRLRMNKDTTTGTISVSRPLDFETKNMYKLQVVALDMYVEIGKDSRNAAAFEVIVVVEDVQDTPPIFTRFETIVHLHNNMSIGHVITKVEAIDGDRGRPRRIKYGLVSENRPFTVLFEIGLFSGEVKLKRSMSELVTITGGKQPAVLTVIADEEVTGAREPPALTTMADLVLILDDVVNSPPYFHNANYACRLNENSGQGTTLVFGDGYVMQVHDDNTGKESVYALTLENNNGTFEVMPAVIDRRSRFTIMVRNNRLLDFESRPSVHFEVVATELSVSSGGGVVDSNRSRMAARASITVYLDDVNDNAPRFTSAAYYAQMPENATAGERVITVEAVDPDTGPFGSVRYTAVLGFRNSSLVLDSQTGVVTVSNDNHGFDREESAEYRLTVEARDMDGGGLATTVPLVIHVLDINDETPVFQDTPIQFVLTQDMRNFTERAFIKAIDKDAEAPNNVVRYEIINGNYNNRFTLNPETGELLMSSGLYDSSRTRRDSTSSTFVVLTIRAYDLGVPHRWSTTQVRIYPPSSGARQMSFLIPVTMDMVAIHSMLERLTGGKVTINTIKPNYDIVQQGSSVEKKIVTATVVYNTNTVIDIEEFGKQSDQCSDKVHMAQVNNHSDKNLSFWLNLLLLLAILLAALSLLFCCCYQQYLQFIHHKLHQAHRLENKGIQAPSLNSSDFTEVDTRQKVYILSEKPVSPLRIAKRTRTKVIPNIAKNKTSAESLLLEDVEGNEYRILDKRRSWSDEMADTRQEMFFKQGNAEILRIMSNDSLEVMDSASNVGAFNVFDELAGKRAIMNKFLNSKPDETTENQKDQFNEDVKVNIEKTLTEGIKKENIEEEQNKMAAFQRDVLLTKFLAEEQQKLMTKLETRSLPGANMATQTETHTGTQTSSSCLRPSDRRSRSNDERDCSRSAHCPRRSSSMPRRHLFNSPIIEETGSGSGASSGLRSATVPSTSAVAARECRRPHGGPFASSSSSSTAAADVTAGDQRRSRSYSSLRELDLDRQLQYMTPSLRSRALARRRLSMSLPPPSGRGPRAKQMLEKKSVFTIAYGDVATQKINCSADSSTNNWD